MTTITHDLLHAARYRLAELCRDRDTCWFKIRNSVAPEHWKALEVELTQDIEEKMCEIAELERRAAK